MSALPLKADTCTALAAVRFGPIADIPPIIRSPPGAELAFSSEVTVTEPRFVVGWKAETLRYATAIFRQVNNNGQWTHHDALEFPDGRIVPLTQLKMPFIRSLFEPWPFWLANRGCSVPRKRTSAGCHVCFTPESGHVQCKVRCLLRARSGHCLSGTRR